MTTSSGPPASTSIQTHAEWADFVARRVLRRRVERIPADQYAALDAADRTAYDEARRRAHANLPIHLSGPFADIARLLSVRIARNDLTDEPRVRMGLALDGDFGGLGKTSLMREVATFEASLAAPQRGPLDNSAWVPVVYVDCPPTATTKKFARRVLDFYGDNLYRSRDDADRLVKLVGHYVRSCGTRLIVVDEITRLRLHRADDANVYDAIRDLQNTGVTLAIVGVGVKAAGLLPDEDRLTDDELQRTQTTRRMLHFRLDRFDAYAHLDAWLDHLAAIEHDLVLLKDPTGTLTEHAAYLLERTGGVAGSLADLVGQAAVLAVGHEEQVTRALLDAVQIDDGAESTYRHAETEVRSTRTSTRSRRASSAKSRNTVLSGIRQP